MPKHNHIKTLAEQMKSTGHGSSPFHYAQMPGQGGEYNAVMIENEGAIKKLAYKIHQEKGGSQLENWLEAEKTLINKQ